MRILLIADLTFHLVTLFDVLYVLWFVIRVEKSIVALEIPLTRA